LSTLKYRRLRGEMIKVFKITHNIYDEAVSPDLSFYARASTRGNNYKLVNHSFQYDLCKHFFARIVNIWNSLPNSIVDASTIYYYYYYLFASNVRTISISSSISYDDSKEQLKLPSLMNNSSSKSSTDALSCGEIYLST